MNRRLSTLLVALAAAAALGLTAGVAAAMPLREGRAAALALREVAGGFVGPVYATAPANEPGRLYVVERIGRVMVVEGGQVSGTPFLDIQELVGCESADCGEQGLLSIAFHPGYAENGRVYANYTNFRGDTEVREFRAEGGRVQGGNGRKLLYVRQPYSNHNGGQIQFGPDGLLYVGMGDGGAGSDPENVSQNLGSRLGKLLTIDVDRRPPRVKIVAYGLRNPWRFSFDRERGDLWIGDVGQNAFEEIDMVRAGWKPLLDFGWDVYEGNSIHERKPRTKRGRLVAPVLVYGRNQGSSVTGGYVYRGLALPSQRGRYFYGDFYGAVWSVSGVRNGKAFGRKRLPFTFENLASFGEDANGELYLVSLAGTVYQLVEQ